MGGGGGVLGKGGFTVLCTTLQKSMEVGGGDWKMVRLKVTALEVIHI